MRIKGLLIHSLLLIGALAVTAIAAGWMLPAAMRLPMHWSVAGTVDRWGDKWLALLMPVGLAIATTAILALVSRIEPQREAMARSEGLVRVIWIGLVGLAWTIELMVLAVAFGWSLAPVRLLVMAMGLLFAAMGDQFGKSRPMRLVGIRTPWTRADPDVWIATHRLGGKLFVMAGLVWFAAGLIGLEGPHLVRWLMAVLLGAALVPAAWSYVYWRRAHR